VKAATTKFFFSHQMTVFDKIIVLVISAHLVNKFQENKLTQT